MLNNLGISLIIFIAMFIIPSTAAATTVFGPTNVFYTSTSTDLNILELCSLGLQTFGAHTLTCTFESPQLNIIRVGLGLKEFNRAVQEVVKFTAFVTNVSPTSFNIDLNISNPGTSGMKMGFFSIVIKAQTTLYVDLLPYSWDVGSTLDTYTSGKSATKKISLQTNSIFTTSVTGLVAYPFSTYYHLIPKNASAPSQWVLVTVTATLAYPNVSVTVSDSYATKIEKYGGFVLIFNPDQYNTDKASGMPLNQYYYSYGSGGGTMNLTSRVPSYGPSFSSKCFTATYYIYYQGSWPFQYNYALTSFGNYNYYSRVIASSARNYQFLFCFANNTMCAEAASYMDALTSGCYLATTCPLPVPVGWTKPNECPKCTQMACQQCSAVNRSQCSSCTTGLNLHLDAATKLCVCDSGFDPVYMPISTSALGKWNNVANSLVQCKTNCLNAVMNCIACVSTKIEDCQTCDVGYYLNSPSLCELCSSIHAQCNTCSDINTCTGCNAGYIINDLGTPITCGQCPDNSVSCIDCSDINTCTQCSAGYVLDNVGLYPRVVCVSCSTIHTQCATCSDQSTCTKCNSPYLIDSLTSASTTSCFLCTDIHAECSTCDDIQTCTQCNPPYLLDSLTSPPTITCFLCTEIHSECSTCDDIQTCTQCNSPYLLDSLTSPPIISCFTCSEVHLECQSCSNINTCTQCSVGYGLDGAVSSPNVVCSSCSINDLQCIECNNINVCTKCAVGYGLDSITSSPNVVCVLCSAIHIQCETCSDQKTCTQCTSPYLLDSLTSPSITTCFLCTQIHSECFTCDDIQTCTQCNSPYLLDSLTSPPIISCFTCSEVHSECQSCSDINTCTQCSVGYGLDNVGLHPRVVCVLCSTIHTQCATCSDQSTCTQCNSPYLIDSLTSASTTSCFLCTDIHSECFTCDDIQTCTQCNPPYLLDSLTSPPTITCFLCTEIHSECSTCDDIQTCTQCNSPYLLDSLTSPPIISCFTCSEVHSECQTCSNINTCTQCSVGYGLDQVVSPPKIMCVQCSTIHTQCQTCSDQSTCTQCNVPYLLDTLTLASTVTCYICSDIHIQCLTCSDALTCTQCASPYILGTRSPPTVTCVCIQSNCTICTSSVVCTDCDINYGFNLTTNQCLRCNTLMFSDCLQCQDQTICLKCLNGKIPVDNGCCVLITYCLKCIGTIANSVCLNCQVGHFLKNDPELPGKQICQFCVNLVQFCGQCDSNACSKCLFPYLLGPTGFCDECLPGYRWIGGFCTNIAGCMNTILLPNGTNVCLACNIPMHFAYNSKTMKCNCSQGYKPIYQKSGFLKQCQPICGDGIVLTQYETCDDGNTDSNDGCDANCKQQTDFICFSEPSKCVLYLNLNKITFNYALRVVKENKAILSFSISPKHKGLEKMNWSSLINFNFSIKSVDASSIKFSYSLLNGELQVKVPYKQDLQNQVLQTFINLDPIHIVSIPTFFLLTNTLNGVNAPLIIEDEQLLVAYQRFEISSQIIVFILLLQFYVASYFHKMIGLETLQIIQLFYFIRMIAKSKKTMILNSINSIEYAASGYQNAGLIFGSNSIQQIQSDQYSSVLPQFLSIELKRDFLLNVNFSLFPVAVALIGFIYILIKKYRQRSLFMNTNSQVQKDKYTQCVRSSRWAYDHFIFPYLMMFNLLEFFNTISYLQSCQKLPMNDAQTITKASFPFHIGGLYLSTGIYCYEVYFSYGQYMKYRMTQRQRNSIPKSLIEKLQHDQNNPDRPNYHPFYTLAYLFYYFFTQIVMVLGVFIQQFQFSFQLILGLSTVYFFIIFFWKPYHSLTSMHNHLLKLNHGSFILFLIICELFSINKRFDNSIYIALMAIIQFLIGAIVIGGFIRIWLQKLFRKKIQQNQVNLYPGLEQNSKQIKQNGNNKQINTSQKQKHTNQKTFKKPLYLKNNEFLFQNQLNRMRKVPEEINKHHTNENIIMQNDNMRNDLSQRQKAEILRKIRKQYAQKRQSLILDEYISTNIAQYQKEQKKKKNNMYKNDEKSQLQQLKRKMRGEWRMMND